MGERHLAERRRREVQGFLGRAVRALREGPPAELSRRAFGRFRGAPQPAAPSTGAPAVDRELVDLLAEIAGGSAPGDPPDPAAGLSADLQAFTRAEPYIRAGILAFIREAAGSIPPGSRVIDVGAGTAPYRELFEHVEYLTTDWAESVHPGAAAANIIAPIERLPVASESFDAAIMTEVLEHLEDPLAGLAEVRRILVPGGRLFLTVPFVWPLHEMPHDHWRYTPSSLGRLLDRSGFEAQQIRPNGNYLLTLAQLLWDAPGLVGTRDDELVELRWTTSHAMQRLAGLFESLSHLDADPTLPMGFTAVAARPTS